MNHMRTCTVNTTKRTGHSFLSERIWQRLIQCNEAENVIVHIHAEKHELPSTNTAEIVIRGHSISSEYSRVFILDSSAHDNVPLSGRRS